MSNHYFFIPHLLPLKRPSGRTLLLYDTFNGEGAITAHTPETPGGAPWTIVNGSFSNLADGRLLATLNNSRTIVNVGLSKIDITADLYMGTNYTTGLLFAWSSNSLYYKIICNRNTSKFELYRYTSIKASYTYSFSSSQVYQVRVTYDSDTGLIKAYFADAEIITYTDPTPIISTNHGFDAGSWGIGSGIDKIIIYSL